MKRILLSTALLLASATMAQDYKYEVSPMIGYNFSEGNLGMDSDGYFVGGLELQFNSADSKISPEFSLYVSPSADYEVNGDTNVYRGAFNGVYTFDAVNSMVPFAKLGGGIEKFSTERYGNEDGFFFDAGAGVKVPFTKQLAFKAEAIYMAKVNHTHAGNADSNLMTLVGLTYSFGAMAPKEAPAVKEEVEEVVIVVVDADKDGVNDDIDKCLNTPANSTVDATGCIVVLDDDNDGVANGIDSCPNTPAGIKVDAKGCNIDTDNDGVVNDMDSCPNTPAGTKVDAKGCDVDMDHDGVLNEQDLCENTPLGEAVNSDGCPAISHLEINFENNSYKVKQESLANIEKFAQFLTKNTNYSAKIVGYTDSRGSASYNQKLSEKRAKEVERLLIADGVNPSQLSAEGRGEANPIATNDTAEGRAKNRRIEAELIRH